MAASKKKQKSPLGRLTSLSIKDPWQVSLLLPTKWEDFTHPLTDFRSPVLAGDCYAVVGAVVSSEARFKGTPRLTGYLSDPLGNRVGFTVFGDTRDLQDEIKGLKGQPALFYGKMGTFNGNPWLDSLEIVHPWWRGRMRPVYPGKKGVIGPALVRDRVLHYLKESIPVAAAWLKEELKGMESYLPDDLASTIWQSHLPQTEEQGLQAQEQLELLAAFGIINAAKGGPGPKAVRAFVPGDWRPRAAQIPYELTGEQQQAIQDSCDDLCRHQAMHRILSGDVGTGKTSVFGTISAAVADGQGKSVILLPNFGLAHQVASELRSYWPDLNIQTVTGESDDTIDPQASILIGTTALLFRTLPWPIDLLVVDEQQKFSREQREKLMDQNTNLLESTATCIPRSMALARYGVVSVSKLTECHCDKTLMTKIWQKEDWKELYNEAMRTLQQGDQLLMVYPLRDKTEEKEGKKEGNNAPELRNATDVFHGWDKRFPGRVRLLHGQMNDTEKETALTDMKEGRADILISTTSKSVSLFQTFDVSLSSTRNVTDSPLSTNSVVV
jgi:ATP-dependent DNA helicase RecG